MFSQSKCESAAVYTVSKWNQPELPTCPPRYPDDGQFAPSVNIVTCLGYSSNMQPPRGSNPTSTPISSPLPPYVPPCSTNFPLETVNPPPNDSPPPPYSPPTEGSPAVAAAGVAASRPWSETTIIYQPTSPKESYSLHITASCLVCWLCGCFFGFLAFLLSVKARTNVYKVKQAHRLGNAAICLMIIGLIVGVAGWTVLIAHVHRRLTDDTVDAETEHLQQSTTTSPCNYFTCSGRCYMDVLTYMSASRCYDEFSFSCYNSHGCYHNPVHVTRSSTPYTTHTPSVNSDSGDTKTPPYNSLSPNPCSSYAYSYPCNNYQIVYGLSYCPCNSAGYCYSNLSFAAALAQSLCSLQDHTLPTLITPYPNNSCHAAWYRHVDNSTGNAMNCLNMHGYHSCYSIAGNCYYN